MIYIYISYILQIENIGCHGASFFRPFFSLVEYTSCSSIGRVPRPDWAVPAAARSQLETMGNDTVNARDTQRTSTRNRRKRFSPPSGQRYIRWVGRLVVKSGAEVSQEFK